MTREEIDAAVDVSVVQGNGAHDSASDLLLAPVIEQLPGGYMVSLPTGGGKVCFRFDAIEQRGRAVESTLAVWQDLPGVTRETFSARIDACSTSNRDVFRRQLDDAFGKADWTLRLGRACSMVIDAVRSMDPSFRLMDAPAEASLPPLLYPFAVAGPVIMFGKGGSAKTFLALDIARAIASGGAFLGVQASQAAVLFIDYEADATTLKDRLTALLADHGGAPHDLPLDYWPARGVPLADMTAGLLRKIQNDDIGFVIVDSAALAAGAEPERAETAIRYFNALANLGVPSLTIAHETKAGEDQWPFGSIFYHNSARATWNAKAIAEQQESAVRVGLFHRKANNSRLEAPVGVRIEFGEQRVRIGREELDQEWDREVSLSKRIRRELGAGALNVKQIAEHLGANADSVRRTLNRQTAIFVKLPGGEAWGLRG